MSESSSKTTTDLKTIQKWAEERDGKPSRVKSTADKKGGGVLRIDFPGYSGRRYFGRNFVGTIGIKLSKIASLLFYTRKKLPEEKRAVFLN